jgi:hypothetical protein
VRRDVTPHTMKTLRLTFHCIALMVTFACSDPKGAETELDDTSSAKAAAEPRSSEGNAVPGAPVVDKLTCLPGCTKISTTEPVPKCCNCNGQDRQWKRAAWSGTTWLCQ